MGFLHFSRKDRGGAAPVRRGRNRGSVAAWSRGKRHLEAGERRVGVSKHLHRNRRRLAPARSTRVMQWIHSSGAGTVRRLEK